MTFFKLDIFFFKKIKAFIILIFLEINNEIKND